MMRVAAILAMLAGVKAADDYVELAISMTFTGDAGMCTTLSEATAMHEHVSSASGLAASWITANDVTGCSRRRRALQSGTTTATHTVTYSMPLSSTGFQTTEGLYKNVAEAMSEKASTVVRVALAAKCECTVALDSISIDLSEEDVEARRLQAAADEGSPAPGPISEYYAGADCPNGCSGHGSCSTNGCVCWSNWGNGDETGGACDQRKCPYTIAWVDTPSSENKAHALRECGGRGLCDRATGDCACFEGYTGQGCRRTVCPNDCSGHGTCEYLAELRNDLGDDFKWTGNLATRDQYDFEFPLLWDAHKTRGCVCDAKWTGLDCSTRMCPRGDYAHFYKLEKKPETQAVVLTNVFNPTTDGDDDTVAGRKNVDYKSSTINDGTDTNGEFALTFRSTLHEEFTTNVMNVYTLTEEIVEEELNMLPNKVIEEASVVLYRNLSKYNGTGYGLVNKEYDQYPYTRESNYSWYDTDLVVLITFNGGMTSGNQYALECKTAYCADGCQPKMSSPIDFKMAGSCVVVNDYDESIAENWECSGRGACGATGTCECFEGYTDEYCSTKTAII